MKKFIILFLEKYGPVFLWKIFYAAVILAAGFLLSRILVAVFSKIFDRSALCGKVLVKNLITRFIRIAVIVITIIMALEKIDLDVSPFIASLGISGLIFGFAFRDTLSNFAAGLLIVIYEPFRAGDGININGTSGSIKSISLVNTHITGFDGLDIYLPNSKVWGSKIINYSRCPYRRQDFDIGVGYNSDLAKVITTLQDIIDKDNRILKDPAPFIRVNNLDDSAITFKVFVYTAPDNFGDILNDFYKIVKDRFDKENIEIPFPQMDVSIKNDNSTG